MTRFKWFKIIFLGRFFQSPLQASDVKDYYSENKERLLKIEKEYVQNFICDITLNWRGETRTRKIRNQVRVVFFEDGAVDNNIESFLSAVREINEALGYEKLIPTVCNASNRFYANDGEIFIYYGDYSKENSLLRSAGSLSAMSGWWGSWNHWDDQKNITRSTIAIDKKKVNGILLAYCLRRSILIPLGFPGDSKNYPANNLGASGLFDCSRIHRILKNSTPELNNAGHLVTEYDKAIIGFSERFIQINSSRSEIKKNVLQNWDNYILDFYNSKKIAAEKN